MAILTSKNGLYEIETLSFSPNAIVWGEKSTCTVSITNKTGKKLSGVFVHLMIYYNAAGDASTKDHFGYTLIDIDGYWAANTTKTLTISVPRYEANVMSGRAIPSFTSRAMPKAKRKIGNTTYTRGCELHVYTSSEAYNDEFEDLYGSNHKYFAIIDKHYLPTISDTFAVNRKNDESTECWTTLQVGYADGLTDVQKARMTCKAYYDGTEITLPDSITQGVLVAGITENYDFLSNQPVDIADDHIIKVVFGDQYEQAEDSRTVMRCFANLHLSGYRTGGVCVGGFCDDEKDSDGNHIAKFECYYPAYFYGGIQGSGGMQGGITESVSIKQNYAEVTVTFPTAFDTGVTPVVMVCLDKAAQDSDRYMALLSAMVVNGSVTNTGFKVRLCSNSSNAYSVAARWLAFAV